MEKEKENSLPAHKIIDVKALEQETQKALTLETAFLLGIPSSSLYINRSRMLSGLTNYGGLFP